MAASKIHADDTPVPVLAPGDGKTRTARLWIYVRDDRPAGYKTAPAVWFEGATSAPASALLRREPPDDESSIMDPLLTVVSEAQKSEGLRFSLPMLLPVSSGEPPEFDQSCLVRM